MPLASATGFMMAGGQSFWDLQTPFIQHTFIKCLLWDYDIQQDSFSFPTLGAANDVFNFSNNEF